MDYHYDVNPVNDPLSVSKTADDEDNKVRFNSKTLSDRKPDRFHNAIEESILTITDYLYSMYDL